MSMFKSGKNSKCELETRLVESSVNWLESYAIYFEKDRNLKETIKTCEEQNLISKALEQSTITDYGQRRSALVGHTPWVLKQTVIINVPQNYLYQESFEDINLSKPKQKDANAIERKYNKDKNNLNSSYKLGLPLKASFFK